jgi:hypothetical protein
VTSELDEPRPAEDDQPQRIPLRSIIVWSVAVVVIVVGVAVRVWMGWRLWPWTGSGPWPGS